MKDTDEEIVRDGVPDDVLADLVARVSTLERTQLAEDVDAFVALFQADATWVTGGRRLVGRPGDRELHQEGPPGAFASASVRDRVELVCMLASDVAVTGVVQTYFDDQGLETSHGLPTYV